MGKKCIVVDARLIGSFGIGTYLKNLLMRMRSFPFDFRLIINPSILSEERWLEKYTLIFCKAPIYSLEEQLILPRLIPKCDLFWSPHFNIPYILGRAKKKVVTIHDLCHLAFFSNLNFVKKTYVKLMLRRVMRIADQVITPSHFSCEEILKYLGGLRENIAVIYPGVDQIFFGKKVSEEREVLFKKRYSYLKKYVLFIGNLKPHKNMKGLLKAFEIFSKTDFEGYQLVVIGKGTEEFYPKIERIYFLGEVEKEELPLFYQNASALVSPSFYEGFGFPLIEAMSARIPVIAANCGSLPEIGGNAAFYVDPHHPKEMAEAIRVILNDSKQRECFVEAGLKRIQLFDWEKSALEHIELFDRIF